MRIDPHLPAARLFRWFWLLALALGLLAAYAAPLERNQEARVLETAREMHVGQAEQWLYPRLNGQLRLAKPPLAYWLAAGAFRAGGVSTFVGRLPFVVFATLTMGVIYSMGRRWFSPTAGLVAAALTLGSSLYQSYGFLAETDALCAFFVTAACLGFCDLLDARDKMTAMGSSLVAGFCVGMAGIAKGPPAAYPVALFLLLVVIERKPRALMQFMAHGGLALALMIGIPWWIIASQHPEAQGIISREMGELAEGVRHGKPFWHAFPLALKATLPWVAPVIGALSWAIIKRSDRPSAAVRPNMVRRLLLWAGLVMVVQTAMTQKQDHYFFPIVPPLMLLAGAAVSDALFREDPSGRKVVGLLLGGTALVAALASPAILLLPGTYSRALRASDLAVAGFLLALFLATLILYRRSLWAGVAATLLAAPLALTLLLSVWGPRLRPASFADVARRIRQDHPGASFVLYPVENYRLNFELGRVIPVYATAHQLEQTLIQHPSLLVIVEESDKPALLPRRLRLLRRHVMHGRSISVYAVSADWAV